MPYFVYIDWFLLDLHTITYHGWDDVSLKDFVCELCGRKLILEIGVCRFCKARNNLYRERGSRFERGVFSGRNDLIVRKSELQVRKLHGSSSSGDKKWSFSTSHHLQKHEDFADTAAWLAFGTLQWVRRPKCMFYRFYVYLLQESIGRIVPPFRQVSNLIDTTIVWSGI
jgi:hypothetical protein